MPSRITGRGGDRMRRDTGRGSGSGDVVLLYLWLLSAFAEDRPAVFSEEAGLGLVEDELRGVTNADYEKGLGQTDVQYTASGRPAVPERDFDGVLSATGSRPGQVFQSWGLSLLFNSGYNIAGEFYPDICGKYFAANDGDKPVVRGAPDAYRNLGL